jgi:hypothetical protein
MKHLYSLKQDSKIRIVEALADKNIVITKGDILKSVYSGAQKGAVPLTAKYGLPK